MIENSRAFKFRNFTRHSTYYAIAFGKSDDGDVENVVVDDDGVEGETDDSNIASENEIGQGVIGKLCKRMRVRDLLRFEWL